MKGVEFLRTELRVGLTASKLRRLPKMKPSGIDIVETPKKPMKRFCVFSPS